MKLQLEFREVHLFKQPFVLQMKCYVANVLINFPGEALMLKTPKHAEDKVSVLPWASWSHLYTPINHR